MCRAGNVVRKPRNCLLPVAVGNHGKAFHDVRTSLQFFGVLDASTFKTMRIWSDSFMFTAIKTYYKPASTWP